MYKRIISIITVLVFCLCAADVSAAETEYTDELLKAFNIGGIDDLNEPVTRAQFIKAVSDILNYESRPQPRDGMFSDVTAADEFSGAVYDSVARNLVSGLGDGTFGADEPILFEQAVKILMTALGYEITAQSRGGYPLGYIAAANEQGVLSGVRKAIGENLSGGEAAALIENALEAQMLIQVGFGTNESYESRRGITLMTEYLFVEKTEGIITDNGETSLTGESRTGRGKVILNGVEYDAGASQACSMLGQHVSAYVTYKKGEPEEIIYIKNEKNAVIKIKSSKLKYDDSDFSETMVVYEDVYGKTEKAKIDPAADFIYNGKADVDIKGDDLKITGGSLVMVDNDNDSVYEVVFVNSSRTITVHGVSIDNMTVYDKNGGEKLVLQDKNVIIEKNGIPAEITELAEWDILTVYESKDKQEITVEASSEKITGIVESYSEETETLLVGGEYYNVNDTELIDLTAIGASYEFCLDSIGNIAAVKAEEQASFKVGFFVKAENTDGISNELQVKIFTAENTHEIYSCAQNVKIDGKPYADSEQAAKYLRQNAVGGLISYKVNVSGQIKEIDLPYSGTPASYQRPESLRIEYKASSELLYREAQNAFEGIINMDSDTVVFLIPEDLEDETGYDIETSSYFMNNTRYAPEAYCMGIEDGRADFMVYTPKDKYTDKNTAILVSKITQAADSEGGITECLYGCSDSGEVMILAKDGELFTSAGIKRGDIVRCLTNKHGRAVAVRKVFDYEENKMVNDANLGYSSGFRVITGNVYHKYGELIGITSVDPSNGSVQEIKENIENQVVTGARIYLYDSQKRGKIFSVTADSIYDYLHMPEEYSKVLVYTRNSACKMVVIYN